MDAGRDDDGRQHVRQRAQGTRRRAVQRADATACHHDGVHRLGHARPRAGFTSANWWPADLGVPSAAGGQNDAALRGLSGHSAAGDPGQRCHQGFSTPASTRSVVCNSSRAAATARCGFTSQFGTFDVSSLRELGARQVAETPAAAPAPRHRGSVAVPIRPIRPRRGAARGTTPPCSRPLPADPIPRPSSRPSNRWPGCMNAASSPTRSSLEEGRTARPALTGPYSVAGRITTTDLVREPSSRSSAITRPSASVAA